MGLESLQEGRQTSKNKQQHRKDNNTLHIPVTTATVKIWNIFLYSMVFWKSSFLWCLSFLSAHSHLSLHTTRRTNNSYKKMLKKVPSSVWIQIIVLKSIGATLMMIQYTHKFVNHWQWWQVCQVMNRDSHCPYFYFIRTYYRPQCLWEKGHFFESKSEQRVTCFKIIIRGFYCIDCLLPVTPITVSSFPCFQLKTEIQTRFICGDDARTASLTTVIKQLALKTQVYREESIKFFSP